MRVKAEGSTSLDALVNENCLDISSSVIAPGQVDDKA
jgi:hypothetical protein